MNNYVIKSMIKNKIVKGYTNFVIYPFGENGLKVKTILQEYFDLLPVFVVDNEYADMNPNILTIHQSCYCPAAEVLFRGTGLSGISDQGRGL